jgi:hypothetical protein
MMLLKGLKVHDEPGDFKLARLAHIIHKNSLYRRPQSGRLIAVQHFSAWIIGRKQAQPVKRKIEDHKNNPS